jgi:sugar transferase (PEP-CTERM/EpsH1 system associated)
MPQIIYGELIMNILFLTSRLPYPPYGGDKLRVFNFIKHLGTKHNIFLLSFIESKNELKEVTELKKYCKFIKIIYLPKWRSYLNCFFGFFLLRPFQVSYYQYSLMNVAASEIIRDNNIDVAYVHLIRMAPYVNKITSCIKLLDMTDAISLSLKRSLKYRKHVFFLFYLVEMLKVKKYEREIVKFFDCNIVISQADKEALYPTTAKIDIVKNGVDTSEFSICENNYNIRKIVFLGNMHSFANKDAVIYFCSEILPLIKKDIENVEFNIIGINIPPAIQILSKSKNINVVGKVSNLNKYMADAVCFVCPIRSGAGLQNKILEAMAMGLPVVTSKIGFEGLGAEENEDLLVADNANDFADKIKFIINSQETRKKLSNNARNFVLKNYSWDTEISHLEKIIKESINKK